MANATLTLGTLTYVTGSTTYIQTKTDGTGEWSIYLGRVNTGNTNDYDSAVLALKVPTISDCLYGRSVTIPLDIQLSMGSSGTLYARLSTTAPGSEYTSFVHGPSSGIISNEVAFAHNSTSLAFTITAHGTVLSDKTIYLYLYAKTSLTGIYRIITNSFSTGTLTYAAPYKLTISAGTGSTVTVNRTSSKSGSTGKLSNNAALYYGDSLTITYAAKTGYEITKATVNNSTIDSGDKKSVSSNIAVVVNAALLTYLLSIAASTGSSVTVKRTASDGGNTGTLADGAKLYYGDELQVEYAAATGYEIETATLNGGSIASGAEHTVTAAVAIVTVAKLMGLGRIGNGTELKKYLAYIGNGQTNKQYVPYVGNGSTWDMLS